MPRSSVYVFEELSTVGERNFRRLAFGKTKHNSAVRVGFTRRPLKRLQASGLHAMTGPLLPGPHKGPVAVGINICFCNICKSQVFYLKAVKTVLSLSSLYFLQCKWGWDD